MKNKIEMTENETFFKKLIFKMTSKFKDQWILIEPSEETVLMTQWRQLHENQFTFSLNPGFYQRMDYGLLESIKEKWGNDVFSAFEKMVSPLCMHDIHWLEDQGQLRLGFLNNPAPGDYGSLGEMKPRIEKMLDRFHKDQTQFQVDASLCRHPFIFEAERIFLEALRPYAEMFQLNNEECKRFNVTMNVDQKTTGPQISITLSEPWKSAIELEKDMKTAWEQTLQGIQNHPLWTSCPQDPQSINASSFAMRMDGHRFAQKSLTQWTSPNPLFIKTMNDLWDMSEGLNQVQKKIKLRLQSKNENMPAASMPNSAMKP